MRKLQIETTGAFPATLINQLDQLQEQEIVLHYQIKDQTIIQIYSDNAGFISSIVGIMDWAKQQEWFVDMTLQCILDEDYLQEKLN